MKKIQLPLTMEDRQSLRAGEQVLLSGVIYTARDAAHKRMQQLLDEGQPLPFDLRGQIIYYVGPTQTPPGMIFGSAGPTTATRMDVYTPQLLDLGLAGMIGKGKRSDEVKAAMIRRAKRSGGWKSKISRSLSALIRRETICTLRILNDRDQCLFRRGCLPL